MIRSSNRYVVRRENNVLQVDFSREPDPPAPRFPGASALRRFGQEDSESSWPFDAERVSPRNASHAAGTRKSVPLPSCPRFD